MSWFQQQQNQQKERNAHSFFSSPAQQSQQHQYHQQNGRQQLPPSYSQQMPPAYPQRQPQQQVYQSSSYINAPGMKPKVSSPWRSAIQNSPTITANTLPPQQQQTNYMPSNTYQQQRLEPPQQPKAQEYQGSGGSSHQQNNSYVPNQHHVTALKPPLPNTSHTTQQQNASSFFSLSTSRDTPPPQQAKESAGNFFSSQQHSSGGTTSNFFSQEETSSKQNHSYAIPPKQQPQVPSHVPPAIIPSQQNTQGASNFFASTATAVHHPPKQPIASNIPSQPNVRSQYVGAVSDFFSQGAQNGMAVLNSQTVQQNFDTKAVHAKVSQQPPTSQQSHGASDFFSVQQHAASANVTSQPPVLFNQQQVKTTVPTSSASQQYQPQAESASNFFSVEPQNPPLIPQQPAVESKVAYPPPVQPSNVSEPILQQSQGNATNFFSQTSTLVQQNVPPYAPLQHISYANEINTIQPTQQPHTIYHPPSDSHHVEKQEDKAMSIPHVEEEPKLIANFVPVDEVQPVEPKPQDSSNFFSVRPNHAKSGMEPSSTEPVQEQHQPVKTSTSTTSPYPNMMIEQTKQLDRISEIAQVEKGLSLPEKENLPYGTTSTAPLPTPPSSTTSNKPSKPPRSLDSFSITSTPTPHPAPKSYRVIRPVFDLPKPPSAPNKRNIKKKDFLSSTVQFKTPGLDTGKEKRTVRSRSPLYRSNMDKLKLQRKDDSKGVQQNDMKQDSKLKQDEITSTQARQTVETIKDPLPEPQKQEKEPEAISAAKTPNQNEIQQKLPDGWKEYIHDTTNDAYYHHEKSGVTTNEIPKQDAPTELSQPTIQPDKEVKEISKDGAELNVNKVSKVPVIEEVTSELAPKDSVDVALEATSEPSSHIQTESKPVSSENTMEPELSSEIPLENTSVNKSTDENSLPEGWIEVNHEETGGIYYYNTTSQETSWEKPTVENVATADLIQEQQSSIATPEPSFHVQTESKPSSISNDNQDFVEPEVASEMPLETNQSESPNENYLPEGWIVVPHEESGKFYYYNNVTQETTWEKPTAKETFSTAEDTTRIDEDSHVEANEAEEPLDHVQKVDESNEVAEEVSGVNYPAEGESITSNEVAELPTESMAESNQVNKSGESTVDTTQKPYKSQPSGISSKGLPSDWIELFHEETGRPYYYHTIDQITSWEKPAISSEDVHEEDLSQVENVEVTAEALGTDTIETQDEPQLEIDNYSENRTAATTHENKVDDANELKPSSQESLPPGWTELYHEETGRYYYYHAENNITTWDRPTVDDESTKEGTTPETNVETAELEKDSNEIKTHTKVDKEEDLGTHVAPQGETKEIETIQHSDFPIENEAEAIDELLEKKENLNIEQETPLPSGWSELYADEGMRYYYHSEYEITSWEKPVVEEKPRPSDEDETRPPSGQYDDDLVLNEVEGSKVGKEVVEEDNPLAGDTQVEKTETNQNQNELPSGWIELFDENAGLSYYYHAERQTTTWDKPIVMSNNQESDIINNKEESPEAEIISEENDDNQNDDVHELAPGWKELYNDEGIPYYYHEESQATSWEKPSFGEDKIDTESENVEPKEEEAMKVPVETEKVEENDRAENNIVEKLLDGWVELHNDEGIPYYYHAESQMTSWDKPTVQYHDKKELNHKAEETRSSDATKQESSDEKQQTLPPGWVELYNDGGIPYYYNEQSQTTSWDKPTFDETDRIMEENVKLETSTMEEKEPETSSKEVYLSNKNEVPPSDIVEQSELYSIDEGKFDTQVNDETPSNESLPPGWVELYDENNQVYYYNENDQITTWDKPTIVKPEAASETETSHKEEEIYVPKEEPLDMSNEKQLDSVDEQKLAPGWVELFDENGTPYYYNQEQGTTSWDKPEAKETIPLSIIKEEKQEEKLNNDEWVELVDEASGQVYYFNKVSNTTTWDKPIEFLAVKSDQKKSSEVMLNEAPKENDKVVLNSAPDTIPKAKQFSRPKCAAVVSFGFGGKLVMMKPKIATPLLSSIQQNSGIKNYKRGKVVIHPMCSLVHEDISKISTPLISQSKEVVLQLIEEQEGDDMLWKLIEIAINFQGRLRNSRMKDEVDRSPEKSIIDLLLNQNISKSNKLSEIGVNHEETRPDPSILSTIETLLERGNREEAIDFALKRKQFTIAILIASFYPKDSDIYQKTLFRYAKEVVSPLRSNSSFLSFISLLHHGRQLDDLDLLCTDRNAMDDRDWKYHLATILSNRYITQSNNVEGNSVLSLGKVLHKHNNIPASHFCFTVGGYALGSLPKFNLLGSEINHPSELTFSHLHAFKLTEALEYARRCGNPSAFIPSFLPYKLQFCRLCADAGFMELAYKYLESIITCSADMIRDDNTDDGKMLREQIEILQDRICVSMNKKALISFKKQEDEKKPSGLVSETIQLFKKNLIKPTTTSSTPEVTEAPKPKSNKLEETINDDNVKKNDTPSDVGSTVAPQPPIAVIKKEEKIAESSSTATTIKSAPPSLTSKRNDSSLKKKQESNENPAPAPSSWRKFFGLPQVADLGQKNEAYYDEKLKRWIFPGDDLDEISKPLPPPPTAMTSAANDEKKEEKKTDDPLAMLMAPVGRTPRHMQQKKKSGVNMMPNGPPPANFNVFQPKKN